MRACIFSAVLFLLKYVFCYSALTARFIVLPHAFTIAIVDAPANAPRGCFANRPRAAGDGTSHLQSAESIEYWFSQGGFFKCGKLRTARINVCAGAWAYPPTQRQPPFTCAYAGNSYTYVLRLHGLAVRGAPEQQSKISRHIPPQTGNAIFLYVAIPPPSRISHTQPQHQYCNNICITRHHPIAHRNR